MPIDVVTDQTAAHDPLHGYVPIGETPLETARAEPDDARHLAAVRASLAAHVEAMLQLRDRGAVVFEYGNNLREQARVAGVDAAARSRASSWPTCATCSPPASARTAGSR